MVVILQVDRCAHSPGCPSAGGQGYFLFAVQLATISSGSATSQPTEIDYAHRLFEVGKFAEADEVYARIADQNAKNSSDHSESVYRRPVDPAVLGGVQPLVTPPHA